MKYYPFIAGLIVFIIGSCESQSSKDIHHSDAGKKNNVQWADTILNIGKIKKDTFYSFSFPYKVIGKDKFRFSKVESSCGCTSIEVGDTSSIVENKTYFLSGKIDTHNMKGETEQYIYILANSDPSFFILTIKGNVQ